MGAAKANSPIPTVDFAHGELVVEAQETNKNFDLKEDRLRVEKKIHDKKKVKNEVHGKAATVVKNTQTRVSQKSNKTQGNDALNEHVNEKNHETEADSHHTKGHHEAFPKPLNSYQDEGMGLFQKLGFRIDADPFNVVALLIFLGAIFHTFMAGSIMSLSHKIEEEHAQRCLESGEHSESILAQFLHFFGEVEAIFGIWVLVLMGAIAGFKDWSTMVHYVSDTVNYIEPMFVVVIMTIAATKPILNFSENIMKRLAQLIGAGSPAAWWGVILTVAPLLGSFITEPAAMTIAALLLVKQFYKLEPSTKFKYATLGLLFVNVSVGGTLSNFAAPPVLMVAQPWDWSTTFMLVNFGWKAAVGIVIANTLFYLYFRRELARLAEKRDQLSQGESQEDLSKVPFWITLVHVLFMVWTVVNAHYPAMFLGGFLFFLGFTQITAQYQSKLELKTAVLVGFFLAGLVNHGGVQGWWISPVLSSLTEIPLMLIATALTAFNDNAAITYLSTLVEGFSPALKYAVVAGAVSGGGLTVIANAPNPAGQSILGKFFPNRAVNPLFLAAGALVPTIIMGLCFMLLESTTPVLYGIFSFLGFGGLIIFINRVRGRMKVKTIASEQQLSA